MPAPFLWFGSGRSGSILDQVYLTFYDKVVLHLLLVVPKVDPSNFLRLISDEPDVDAIVSQVVWFYPE